MSAQLSCGDVCAPVAWQHLQQQVILGAYGAGGFTAVGLLLNLAAPTWTANLRRYCLRLEYGLASLTSGTSLALTVSHLGQCFIWSYRAATSQVDPIYHAVEMILSLFVLLDVIAVWVFVVTRGSRAVLTAALNGRFLLDCLVITSIVAISLPDDSGDRTWFTFSFLASFRLLRVLMFLQRIDAYSSNSSWSRQVIYHVLVMVLFVFASAASTMIVERLGDPSPAQEPPWDLAAGAIFTFATMFTVGDNAFNPKSVLGRAFAVCLLCWSLFNLATRILPLMLDQVLGKGCGNGSYRRKVYRTSGHVAVFGTPTGPMLWDLLQEIYHPNHFKAGMVDFDREAPDIVVMVSNERTLAHFRRYLGRQESLVFRERVIPLLGDAFNPEDLERAQIRKALRAIVLPNLTSADAAEDDHANLMRMFAIQTAAPKVPAVCLLHHAENAPASDENASFLSMDKFKLSLMGVGCLSPGSLSFVSNLCKTVGQRSFTATRPWQEDYENSLGAEIYEVPLSAAYHGATFSQVYEDTLARSAGGDVYLIGIVEQTAGEADKWVCIHPGAQTRLRVLDFESSGIFVAPEYSAVLQCPAGEEMLTMRKDVLRDKARLTGLWAPATMDSSPVSSGTQKMSFLDSPTSSGPTRRDMAEKARKAREQDRNARNKQWEQELAAKGYQQSMAQVQHRLLVEGFKLRVVSEVADKLQEGARVKNWDVGVGALGATENMAIGGREEGARVKNWDVGVGAVPPKSPAAPKAPTSPKSQGEIDLAAVAAAIGVPTEDEWRGAPLNVKNAKALDFEKRVQEIGRMHALHDRVADEAYSLPMPPKVVLENGGHLLLCVVNEAASGTEGGVASSRGPNIGIAHFMRPLRDKRLQAPSMKPSVVILAEALPGDWHTVADNERVYFVPGSALNLEDLDACGFRKASSIAIIRGRRAQQQSLTSTQVADSRVLLASSLIESNLPNDSQTPVITDHAYFGSCGFLPKRSNGNVEAPPADAVCNVGILPDLSRVVSKIAGMIGLAPGEAVAALSFQPNSLDGGHLEEDYESLEFSDYLHHERYMRGQVFVSSVVTGLAGCTVYNPSLVLMVSELLKVPMLLLPVPQEWERKAYADFTSWLLSERNLLAVAIYRGSAAADAGAYGRVDFSAPTHFYTYTGPPSRETLMIRSDRVLCLLPRAN